MLTSFICEAVSAERIFFLEREFIEKEILDIFLLNSISICLDWLSDVGKRKIFKLMTI